MNTEGNVWWNGMTIHLSATHEEDKEDEIVIL